MAKTMPPTRRSFLAAGSAALLAAGLVPDLMHAAPSTNEATMQSRAVSSVELRQETCSPIMQSFVDASCARLSV